MNNDQKPRELWINQSAEGFQVWTECRSAGCYHMVDVGDYRSFKELQEKIVTLTKQRDDARREIEVALRERITSENYHSERMVEWVKAGAKNAVTSFTSGPQRQIAYAVEALMKGGG